VIQPVSIVVFNGLTTWTPTEDCVVSAVRLGASAAVDVVVSTDPGADINFLLTGPAVYRDFIAFFSSAQPEMRACGWPLGAGETVYFSADAAAVIVLEFLAPA